MSEEEIKSVEEEAPEVVAQATETEEVQKDEAKGSAGDKKRRNDVEYNWAEARRRIQELERKTREQDELLKQSQPKAAPEEDDLARLSKDDIITVEQAEKIAERRARKIAEEVIKQREASTVDERLSVKFSDFADVVTKENIELLKQNEPELAYSLSHSPDPYAQGVAAYKLLKKLGISSTEQKNQDKERALKNAQKPVSVNAVTKQSAIGNAHLFENGLTPELKSQLLKEMRECAKRS